MNYKYGIKCLNLKEYNSDFIDKLKNGTILWKYIPRNKKRIITFLTMIAKIKFNHVNCYSCLPHEFSSEYYVFVDIDNGNLCLLLSTIRNSHQYPDSNIRIKKLQDELLLLDVDTDILLNHRKEMLCQQHPNE